MQFENEYVFNNIAIHYTKVHKYMYAIAKCVQDAFVKDNGTTGYSFYDRIHISRCSHS